MLGRRSSRKPVRQAMPRAIHEWAAAWNALDAQRMADLFTEDAVYTDNAFGARYSGHDGAKAWVELVAEELANVKVSIDSVLASGNEVAVRWRFTATARQRESEDSSVPGESRQGHDIDVPAMSAFELQGERIRRITNHYEGRGLWLARQWIRHEFEKDS